MSQYYDKHNKFNAEFNHDSVCGRLLFCKEKLRGSDSISYTKIPNI